jgi:dTDP-4-dehydrorhamnose reductase
VTAIIEQCRSDMRARFADAGGVIHVATSGETSWHGFASAIVDRLRARGDRLQVKNIIPIRTQDYAAKACRPHNSRLDLTRLSREFGIVPPAWEDALTTELCQAALSDLPS